MRIPVLFLSLLIVIVPASANSIRQSSFAYGYMLELDGNGPIYEVDIPEHVYQTVTNRHYADIRIYNSDGDSVPHLVKLANNVIEENRADIAIPLFPITGDMPLAVALSGSPSIHIETGPSGAIVDITPDEQAGTPADSGPDSYILDVSQLKNKPQALTLNWSDKQGDFNETVSISGSQDLVDWRSLNNRAPLTNLHFAGHHIINRQIRIGNHNYKYLRLQWTGARALQLDSVKGQYNPTYKDRQRNTITVTSNRFDAETRSFYFTTPGHYPADKLTVKLKPRNAILLASLSSSNKPDGPWVHRYSGLIYNLEKNGKDVQPQEINLPQNSNDKYWRLVANNERDGLANMAPTLQLGWLAHKLVFIAQGNPPFTLAYGHSSAQMKNYSALSNLVKKQVQEDKAGSATVGRRIDLSGASALIPVVDNSAKWKSAILWAVLIIGLLALLAMVLRLYKQMDSH